MDQIRVTFLAFLSVAVMGAGVSAFAGKRSQMAASTPNTAMQTEKAAVAARIANSVTSEPTLLSDAATAIVPARAPASTVAAVPAAQTPARTLPAFFSLDVEANPAITQLPTFICGTGNTGAHLTLLHIQAEGLDVAHGFRLGIVPFGLNTDYDASAVERADMLRAGNLDCDIASLAVINAHGPGIATALIGPQSPIQIWTRDLGPVGTTDRTRLAYEAGGPSERRIRVAFAQLGLPESALTLLPKATLREALAAFHSGQANAVAGWQPAILEAEISGGVPLIGSDDSGSADAVLLMARSSVTSKFDTVMRFHLAWFDAISHESQTLESAALAVAEWGHNDWTGISLADSADDWRALIGTSSPFTLARNAELLKQPASLMQHINAMRPTGHIKDDLADFATDPRFVQKAWDQSLTLAKGNPDATEDLSDALTHPLPGDQSTVRGALADCARIEFVPGTLEIETASRLQIEACVLPALAATPNSILRVRGSSAWPGPKGAHTRAEVEGAARQRADAVLDYLLTLGVNQKRLMLATVLPPLPHRESEDIAIQAADRYVELALILPGF